jgi:hypothetical protein
MQRRIVAAPNIIDGVIMSLSAGGRCSHSKKEKKTREENYDDPL